MPNTIFLLFSEQAKKTPNGTFTRKIWHSLMDAYAFANMADTTLDLTYPDQLSIAARTGFGLLNLVISVSVDLEVLMNEKERRQKKKERTPRTLDMVF